MDQQTKTQTWESISQSEIHTLKRGDYVDISFFPHSQKHFFDPDYDFYFPNYKGKILSSRHTTLGEILIKNENGKTHTCDDRAGTSATNQILVLRGENCRWGELPFPPYPPCSVYSNISH